MAIRRTKAELAAIAAEAAADAVLPAAAPSTPRRRKTATPTAAEPAAQTVPAGPAYRLDGFEGKTVDDVYSWTATLNLGDQPSARVVWSGAKKTAAVQPLAKTTGADDEVKRFEATARRLLPGRDPVTDLVKVLIYTCEPDIKPFNRVALLKDVAGSEPIAFDSSLIVPAP